MAISAARGRELAFPDALQRLSFLGVFQQPMEKAKFPDALQSFSFEHDFNQPIEKAKFPAETRAPGKMQPSKMHSMGA